MMVLWVLVGIALPSIVCYLTLRRGLGSDAPLGRALAASLAPGLGLGLASCVSFALLSINPRLARTSGVDATVWTAVILLASLGRRRSPGRREEAQVEPWPARWRRPTSVEILLATGAAVVVGFAALSMWLNYVGTPHGQWDAWAVWNLRARAIWRGMPDWTATFSTQIPWSAPDYPLLVQLSVVRLWTYAGRDTTVVPAMLGVVFVVASLATVMVSVASQRGSSAGVVAGMALIAAPAYVFFGASQCADVPLGFFILASLALLSVRVGHDGRGSASTAAGIAIGLATWTKPEGVFLPIVLLPIAFVFASGARLRTLRSLSLGAVPGLIALVWFKWRLATPGYMFAGQTPAAALAKVLDVPRVLGIVGQEARMMMKWGGRLAALQVTVAAVVVFGYPDRSGLRRCLIGLALVIGILAADTAAYIATPLNVTWQIGVSFDRLLVQVWPAAVWSLSQLMGRDA